jgi:beta-phosphoglucomutase-like phosphatase (HAD superfamily)
MIGIGAVIFDFNGVLVDDESVHFALFREVLAQQGVTITEQDYYERYLGYDDRRCFQAALGDAGQFAEPGRLDELIAQKARLYAEVADRGLRFFPAAADMLGAVAARWPVAICSGALRSEIEHALRRLDRYEQVTAIISAEDTEKSKPDPECYRLALVALQAHARDGQGRAGATPSGQEMPVKLRAAECLVVEDSLAGIASAKGAGMRAIGVPNTYTALQLRQAGADDIVDGLAALTPDWIERRFGPWLASSPSDPKTQREPL